MRSHFVQPAAVTAVFSPLQTAACRDSFWPRISQPPLISAFVIKSDLCVNSFVRPLRDCASLLLMGFFLKATYHSKIGPLCAASSINSELVIRHLKLSSRQLKPFIRSVSSSDDMTLDSGALSGRPGADLSLKSWIFWPFSAWAWGRFLAG